MNRPYIINDAEGNPINAKYPPDKELYGDEFNGYKNRTEEVLFYEFMVLEKDVSFTYNGVKYYFYKHNTLATVYNATKKEIIAEYPNELELIENFPIDGIPFLKLRDKIFDLNTYRNVFKPHFDLDKEGYPYNCKYPPNKKKYGDSYEGYKNWAEEVLFYRFGVLCYDVSFTYKGKEFFLLKEYNHAATCDKNFTVEYEVYADEMELIENFKIDGKPLIELIDKIQNIDSE